LVTGSNAGLGLEAAKLLATRGARVLMACRNLDKAERAAAEVRAVATSTVEIVPLDLASLASVAAAAKLVADAEERLDLLLNNAGLMAVDHATTEDGFEMQLGVNHLGHFALTARLAPLVLGTPKSRIVNMSSMGHRMGRLHLDDLFFERRGYDRWRPYFQSKLANILFTRELHRRLTEAGATTLALAAHPGGTNTDLGNEGHGITNRLGQPVMKLGMPPAAGVLPFLRAATDPAAKGGEYYGPRWMLRGAPVRETPSRAARNDDHARRLWERSEELTGVTFDVTHPFTTD
jgi:NAD(P)-dependent dehydrogenase (short-subunit alcohol dehydrogenase family)